MGAGFAFERAETRPTLTVLKKIWHRNYRKQLYGFNRSSVRKNDLPGSVCSQKQRPTRGAKMWATCNNVCLCHLHRKDTAKEETPRLSGSADMHLAALWGDLGSRTSDSPCKDYCSLSTVQPASALPTYADVLNNCR